MGQGLPAAWKHRLRNLSWATADALSRYCAEFAETIAAGVKKHAEEARASWQKWAKQSVSENGGAAGHAFTREPEGFEEDACAQSAV